LYHRPNFKAILAVLGLRPDDNLLEVGCGGGAFLQDALKSGCKAAAIDHSSDMVRVAREVNHAAIQQNRLEIREADASSLPYPDGIFSGAVMTGVFGFITNPLQALSEIRRVLAPGGRLVLFTGSKELRGTPAAPEPNSRDRRDLARHTSSGLTLSLSRVLREYPRNIWHFSRDGAAGNS
jgi:ubiquinone/menaquinone biosynthesis C-methylase UbiE